MAAADEGAAEPGSVTLNWTRYEVPAGRNKPGSLDCAPMPCFLHSATQAGAKVVVFGGSGYFGDPMSQLLVFDTETATWTMPTQALGMQGEEAGARYGHSATLTSMNPPQLIVFGGMQGGATFNFGGGGGSRRGSGGGGGRGRGGRGGRGAGKRKHVRGQAENGEEPDNGAYVLEMTGDSWNWRKPLIRSRFRPLARSEHSAVKVGGNRLFVFGGWCEEPLADLQVLNFEDWTWETPETNGGPPPARYRHTASLVGKRMFVLGGSGNGEDRPEDATASVLNVEDLTWTTADIVGDNPFPRTGHATVVLGSHLLAVFGGKLRDESFCNDVHVIDTDTMVSTYVLTEGAIPAALASASCTKVGNQCYAFGGTDDSGMCFNDVNICDFTPLLSPHDISVAEGEKSDYVFKILIIGDASVGKSALLMRFTEDTYADDYTSTIGIDFSTRMIRVAGKVVKLEIWDTAGQERFSTITSSYYRGAQGVILVYDVTSSESFEHIHRWVTQARKHSGDDIHMLLVGNKTDLAEYRQVDESVGKNLAVDLDTPFVETSAKEAVNVERAFLAMARKIKEAVEARGETGIQADQLARKGITQLTRSEGAQRGQGAPRRQCRCG